MSANSLYYGYGKKEMREKYDEKWYEKNLFFVAVENTIKKE